MTSSENVYRRKFESCIPESDRFVWGLHGGASRNRVRSCVWFTPIRPEVGKRRQRTRRNIIAVTKYIVDIFHAEKHTRPKCVLGNDQCYYHPHLEKFAHLRKMNTEVAEQSFTHITPFKSITRKMRYGKRLVYLKLLDDYANERMVRSRWTLVSTHMKWEPRYVRFQRGEGNINIIYTGICGLHIIHFPFMFSGIL